MNLSPEEQEKKDPLLQKTTLLAAIKTLLIRIWKSLLHNLTWKFFAVFLALCLWAGLITQDPTLTRERIFNDVPITILGSDTLQRNALVLLTDFDNEPLVVRLHADVPQREYNTVLASNYNPRIDLSRITQPGTQTLRILTSSTTVYGSVQEVVPDSVEVVIEDYVTNYRIPASIEIIGQYPKGFYAATPSINPSTISISGPKSVIDQVARVVVDFDVSNLRAQPGSSRTALPVRFVDASGNPVESKMIDVTNAGVLLRTVIVEQTLYPTKTLPVASQAIITGKPSSGYEVKSVTSTPNVLQAAGDEIGLNALDMLFIDTPINVTGKDESFTVEIEVKQPQELVYLSSKTVIISVEIAAIIDSREFEGLRINYVDRSTQRMVSSDTKLVFVTLTGPSVQLSKLKRSALSAFIDVTDLSAGEHELPIMLDIQGAIGDIYSYETYPPLVTIMVEIP